MKKLIVASGAVAALALVLSVPAFAAGAPTAVPPSQAGTGLSTAAATAAGTYVPTAGSITVPTP